MRRRIVMTGILCVAVLASACVNKAKYQTALDTLQKCQVERTALEVAAEEQRREFDEQLATLNKALESAGGERDKILTEFAASKKATLVELTQLRKQRKLVEASLAQWKKLTGRFQKMIDSGKIKVHIRRGRMIVSLPSSVLFASGKADLSDGGKQALGRVATLLKDFPKRRFLVTGHTDSQPIRSSKFADNWDLSAARALTVTKYLIEAGLNPKNLVAGGYGQFDPLVANRTPKQRARNRRIELILMPNIAELPRMPK